jgi:hypothetical protein
MTKKSSIKRIASWLGSKENQMQKSHKQYSNLQDSKRCKGWKTTQKNQYLL